MYGIFMESLVILKLYTGLRALCLLFVAAWFYLLFTEKNKARKMMFVLSPVLIIALFLFPLSRKFFVAAGLDGQTYYRVLWTVPMGLITVYAACRLFAKHKRIGLVIMTILIVLCGSYVYKSPYITKAENAYHIPDTAVKICELIAPEYEDDHVMVVVPEELVYFIRQYDARIRMPYGREMIASQWNYYNAVHEAMEETEVIDLEVLIEECRKVYCQYIVISPTREVEGDPGKLGLLAIAEIDGYRIYKDPVTAEVVESWRQYYEEEED